MHEAALAHHGLPGSYRRLDAPGREDLVRAFAMLREGSLDGFNVTLPWKLDAARMVAELGGELFGAALRLGAVNTVVARRSDGALALEGHNTDVPGLVAAIRERWPDFSEHGHRVGRACVLGAGGAAYSAVLAAELLGYEEVRVWNRSPATAQTMVSTVGRGIVVTELEQATSKATLVLQATTLGMGEHGEAFSEAVAFATRALQPTSPEARVVDLVYEPRPTAWVLAAQSLGREADDGLAMLIHQAALAFSLWTGRPPPVEVMRAAANAALEAASD
jgi:shikimate dehydrogenase